MANKFEIQVVALDKFTNVFRKLNNQASLALRPAMNAQKQFVALGRELHLDKLTKGFRSLSEASVKVASSLGLATGPMEAIFGLGAAGGVVAAAAAVGALGARWGSLGYEIGRTSQTLGVSTEDLQRYRGAAKLAGLSQEALTNSFATLGTTLQDAANGRNGDAYNILNSLGIGIKRTKDGVVDVTGTFIELSRAITRTNNPQVQALIANAFGLREMLPLLRQGPEEMAKLVTQAEKFGVVANGSALEGAKKFGETLDALKLAIEGVADTWGQRLTPLLTRGMESVLAGGPSGGIGWSDIFGLGRNSATWRAAHAMFGGGAAPGMQRSSGFVDGLPIGLRQNNPGNLRSWAGAGSANGFASFNSSQDGLNAMAQQVGLYGNRDGLRSISGIVGKYAPPGVDGNNTGAYIADVARETGFDPNAQLNINDPKVMAPLLSAMVRHEQGQQPFGAAQYEQAAQTVHINVAVGNAPPGTRVTTQGAGAPGATVSYSLPLGDTP